MRRRQHGRRFGAVVAGVALAAASACSDGPPGDAADDDPAPTPPTVAPPTLAVEAVTVPGVVRVAQDLTARPDDQSTVTVDAVAVLHGTALVAGGRFPTSAENETLERYGSVLAVGDVAGGTWAALDPVAAGLGERPSIDTIAAKPDGFVAVGSTADGLTAFHSPNGRTWTSSPVGAPASVDETGQTVSFAERTLAWSGGFVTAVSTRRFAAETGAPTETGSIGFTVSADGVVWGPVVPVELAGFEPGGSPFVTELVEVDGALFASVVGDGSAHLVRSLDGGATWADIGVAADLLGTDIVPSALASFDGALLWFAPSEVDPATGATDAAVFRSDDGTAFTEVPVDDGVLGGAGGQRVEHAVEAGGRLLAVGTTTGDVSGGQGVTALEVWSTEDLSTWTRAPRSPVATGLAHGVSARALAVDAAGGDAAVVVGADEIRLTDEQVVANDAAIEARTGFVSPAGDGAIWVVSDVADAAVNVDVEAVADPALGGPGDQYLSDIVETPDGLVAVGAATEADPAAETAEAAWRSPDGERWDPMPVDAAGGPGDQSFASVAVVDGTLVALGSTVPADQPDGRSSATVWRAEDGDGWLRSPPDPLLDGLTPTVVVAALDGVVVVGTRVGDTGASVSVLRSDDGLTGWSELAAGAPFGTDTAEYADDAYAIDDGLVVLGSAGPAEAAEGGGFTTQLAARLWTMSDGEPFEAAAVDGPTEPGTGRLDAGVVQPDGAGALVVGRTVADEQVQTVVRTVEVDAASAVSTHTLTSIVQATDGAAVPGGALFSGALISPIAQEAVLLAVGPSTAGAVVLERSARTEGTSAAAALAGVADGRVAIVGSTGFAGERDGAVWLVDLAG